MLKSNVSIYFSEWWRRLWPQGWCKFIVILISACTCRSSSRSFLVFLIKLAAWSDFLNKKKPQKNTVIAGTLIRKDFVFWNCCAYTRKYMIKRVHKNLNLHHFSNTLICLMTMHTQRTATASVLRTCVVPSTTTGARPPIRNSKAQHQETSGHIYATSWHTPTHGYQQTAHSSKTCCTPQIEQYSRHFNLFILLFIWWNGWRTTNAEDVSRWCCSVDKSAPLDVLCV